MDDYRTPEDRLRDAGATHQTFGHTDPNLRSFLSIDAWTERPVPPPDRLLGDLVTTSSRAFLVGRTGLGKTMFGLAMACGIATGTGFLHWRSARPARVLYIDGEMPSDLLKARSIDAKRRVGTTIPPDNLIIYARDMEDEIARMFPAIGRMPALNTEGGRNWLLSFIDAIGGVDVVIFDNVMSLLNGVQKDEEPWSDALPLVTALTAKRIGQVWFDHTGHNSDRQYGSSTKSWRFDAVGVMKSIEDENRKRSGCGVEFDLSFDPPGKARRRTPDNWQDFAPCRVCLEDDRWTSEIYDVPSGKHKHVSPKIRLFYKAMHDAMAAGNTIAPGKITRSAWVAECIRRNLVEKLDNTDTATIRSKKLALFRKAVSELQAAGLIGADGDTFTDLKFQPR